jgi:hypothetical protein
MHVNVMYTISVDLPYNAVFAKAVLGKMDL